MDDSLARIDTDEALRILAADQRRTIVRRLAESDAGTTVDQLAAAIEGVAASPGDDTGAGTEAAVALHHVHLPMLAEVNVVTYDATRGTVGRGPAFEDVRGLLGLVDRYREDGTPADAGRSD